MKYQMNVYIRRFKIYHCRVKYMFVWIKSDKNLKRGIKNV